jgi:signal transduction histidine kinase
MKKHSISWNLTVSTLIAVMVVSGIGIFSSYYIATQRTKANLNEKADEYLFFIVNTVGEPLWYLNERHLKEIVTYFDKNEHIAGLSITDTDGKKIFKFEREEPGTLIGREAPVYFDGNPVGTVQLSLTARFHEEINRQALWSSVIIVCSVLFILVVTIRLLLRAYLRKPLNDLKKIALSYGAGNYNPPIREEIFDEFRTIVTAFQRMGEQIQLQMSKTKERERLAAIGELSGNISHEMKNSLGVIDSSVYYLNKTLGSKDEKVLRHLERIKSAVTASDVIIKSLADLTRQKALSLERLHLGRLMETALKDAVLSEKIEVIRNFGNKETVMHGDAEALSMAFRNIIQNADRSMEGTGTITITIRQPDETTAEISFTDTGPGITGENLIKIFQPLFTTRAKGMGFGLSITRMIIEKHQGHIDAASREGKGAVFTVQLPTHLQPVSTNKPPAKGK